MKLLTKQFVQESLGQIANNISTLLTVISGAVYHQYKPDDNLAKAFKNPNSIYIPFSKIRSVKKDRRIDQGNFIQLAVEGFNVVICQDMKHEGLKSLISLGTGEWHNDLVKLLHERAKRNVHNSQMSK